MSLSMKTLTLTSVNDLHCDLMFFPYHASMTSSDKTELLCEDTI